MIVNELMPLAARSNARLALNISVRKKNIFLKREKAGALGGIFRQVAAIVRRLRGPLADAHLHPVDLLPQLQRHDVRAHELVPAILRQFFRRGMLDGEVRAVARRK